MKKIPLIIGFLLLFLWPHTSRADYCALGESSAYSSDYRDAYCNLRLHKNRNLNDEIFLALADQLGYSKETVEAVLTQGDLSCGNEVFSSLCAQEGSDLQSLSAVKARFRQAYDKEKALQLAKRKLTAQFRASEKYWDGRLADLGDAPFDLMTDLNLLEVALFGSRAQWTYNVFEFPTKEEEDGSQEGQDDFPLPQPQSSQPAEEGEGGNLAASDPGLDINPVNCVPNEVGEEDKPMCGNSVLNVLAGETCDDGNTLSGDGCSSQCLEETAGEGDVCRDPEAVTFINFADIQERLSAEGEENSAQECPPGTHPEEVSVSGGGAITQPEYPQGQDYPGSLVGGVFKQFAPSSRPACPMGQSEIQVDLINGQQESACVPTELCGDFNQARDFLFGADWENSEDSQTARSIEALFCVEVVTNNRPLSPYGLNEGCIDCHIRAIADKIEEALTTNVTPLENTMNAFSISSRWGPTFSFDLNAVVRSNAQMSVYKRDEKKDKENQAERISQDTKRKTDPGQSSLPAAEGQSQTVSQQEQKAETSQQAQAEAISDLSQTSSAVTDVDFSARIVPLLNELEAGFAGLRQSYSSMAETAVQLASKDQCTF